MKTILSIGCNHFLLAANANVNAVLALLNKAQAVERDYTGKGVVYRPADERYVSMEITMIQDSQFVRPPARKQIAERASEDAHNTELGELPLVVTKVVPKKGER